MKYALFLTLVIASVNAFATEQVPPETATSESKPLMVPPVVMTPPIAVQQQPGNEELMNLLRAQTTAIETLSSKLGSLESRLNKIEKRRH